MMSTRNRVLQTLVFFLLISGGLSRTELVHAYKNDDFTASPPFATASAPPLVMLVMARDDKLYSAAYNDASDLNNDGVLDVGYNPGIDYYGYFDSYKCYSYSSGDTSPTAATDSDKFSPTGPTVPVTATQTKPKTCKGQTGGPWSGDWLNYVTMSRMDTIRKVLFGGFRSVDSTTETVLRRTYIPQDAHSWGKSYQSVAHDGYDISDYTPLAIPTTGRHLFANTTLSDNGTPLLRVLPNNFHQIWDWVAKERPEASVQSQDPNSPDYTEGNYSGYPSDHSSFEGMISAFANASHLLGTLSPTTVPKVTQIDSDDTDGTHTYSTSNHMPFTNPHNSNSDYYLDIFTADLVINTAGSYTFAVNGDDNEELLIDDNVVVGWYNSNGHGKTDAATAEADHSATLTLSAGTHFIEFRHQEKAGDDSYYLYWKGPDSGAVWQIVPAYVSGGGGLNNLSQSFYDVYLPASTVSDYTVQVKVCAPGLLGSNCKQYTDTTSASKPTGLLQRYGESGSMLFGLITGSYTKNLSGGVLRKNIGPISDEINLATGQFSTVNGIIKTINKLRVTGYGYPADGYQYYYYQHCDWITYRPIEEGECRMWGNPIGEMMYETLRYFSGAKTPTAAFDYTYNAVPHNPKNDTYTDASNPPTDELDDNNLAYPDVGLPKPAWIDPYDTANGGFDRCSKPFMLVISDVNPSYDSNSVPGADANFGSILPERIGSSVFSSPLTSSKLDVKELANLISHNEAITSGQYYIGQQGSNYDSVCSAKDITGFGDIRGLCPEEPSKQGSYYSAAVAYYGRIHDISTTAADDQNVTTYAVGMSSPLPRITIPVGDKTITLVPFGKSVGGCYYTDLTKGAFQPTENIASFFVDTITPTYGKFRINYEDVEQGADHDMDAIVLYEYQLVGDDNLPVSDPTLGTKVKISLSSDYAAGCIIQHMGYIISGTTADGDYLEVRDSDTDAASDPDYFLDTPPNQPPNGVWQDGVALPLKATRYFTPGNTGAHPAQILQNPLWYAAKYGGFEEKAANTSNTLDGNNIPDQQSEFDKDGDGLPDNYFYVTNPLKLEEQLGKSFANILRRASSGAAASVISNSQSGEGAVYQSIFYPLTSPDTKGNSITWVGEVQALFVDVNGNLREDTPSGDPAVANGQLNVVKNTSASADPLKGDCGDLIVTFTSTATGTTINKFADCAGTSDPSTATPIAGNFTMHDINYLWRAGHWLNNIADPLTQRTLNANSTWGTDLNKRYIFTFIDHGLDVDGTYKQFMVPKSYLNQVLDFSCPMSSSDPTQPDLTQISDNNLIDQAKIYPYLNVYPPFETLPTGVPTLVDLHQQGYTPDPFTGYLKKQMCREINYIRGADQPAATYTYTGNKTTPASYTCNKTGTGNNYKSTCGISSNCRGGVGTKYCDLTPASTDTTSGTLNLQAFRSRQYDYEQNGGTLTWRLGDIIYSSPTAVGRPAENYHLLYHDASYAPFLSKYINRRNVVYAGANDGMVHAFNAGFYNDALKKYTLRPYNNATSLYDTSFANFDLGAELWAYVPFNLLPHLLWLTDSNYQHVYYVDQKPRVFDARIFFNGSGQAIDSDHPKGWGTVMVIGMRLGGGTVCSDADKAANVENSHGLLSSCSTSNAVSDVPMSSAYVVMDITNPEKPPTLLAELKFPGLGYTTCYPTVIPMGKPNEGDNYSDNASAPADGWYLIFGSGPAESDGRAGTNGTGVVRISDHSLRDAASLQNGKLYLVDLKKLASSNPQVATLTNAPTYTGPSYITNYPANGYQNTASFYYMALDANSFISDPITVDYNLDYRADEVYFGTVNGTLSGNTWSWDGKLRRILINNDPTVSDWVGDNVLLASTGLHQPITAAPTASVDPKGNRWIFFGTGRYFTSADSDDTNQQTYYGIKESWPSTCASGASPASAGCTATSVNRNYLVDTTNAAIYEDGTFSGVTIPTGVTVPTSCSTSPNSWNCLVDMVEENSDNTTSPHVIGTQGWKLDFLKETGDASLGERNLGQAALLGSTLTFTTYLPSPDICIPVGNSNLYGIYYLTGTQYFRPVLGETTSVTINGLHKTKTNSFEPLGYGLTSTPNIHVGGEQGSTVFVQTSTGAIKTISEQNVGPTKSGIRSWKVDEQ